MQASPTDDRPLPVLRIRRDALKQHRDAAGITSNQALATRIGVTASTVQRVIAHQVEPSGRFISGVLKALPEARFEDLFEH